MVVGVLCLAVFGHTMVEPNGWRRRSRLAQDLFTLKAENDATEERLVALRSEISALSNRPDVQEHAVRDELGYVRPSDLVLSFDSQ